MGGGHLWKVWESGSAHFLIVREVPPGPGVWQGATGPAPTIGPAHGGWCLFQVPRGRVFSGTEAATWQSAGHRALGNQNLLSGFQSPSSASMGLTCLTVREWDGQGGGRGLTPWGLPLPGCPFLCHPGGLSLLGPWVRAPVGTGGLGGSSCRPPHCQLQTHRSARAGHANTHWGAHTHTRLYTRVCHCVCVCGGVSSQPLPSLPCGNKGQPGSACSRPARKPRFPGLRDLAHSVAGQAAGPCRLSWQAGVPSPGLRLLLATTARAGLSPRRAAGQGFGSTSFFCFKVSTDLPPPPRPKIHVLGAQGRFASLFSQLLLFRRRRPSLRGGAHVTRGSQAEGLPASESLAPTSQGQEGGSGVGPLSALSPGAQVLLQVWGGAGWELSLETRPWPGVDGVSQLWVQIRGWAVPSPR